MELLLVDLHFLRRLLIANRAEAALVVIFIIPIELLLWNLAVWFHRNSDWLEDTSPC